jgi:hypothetical protein
MKKLNLLIIVAFLLFGLTKTNAQDSSNDATWEETIEFINKNSNYFIHSSDGGIVRKIKITNTILYFEIEFRDKIPSYYRRENKTGDIYSKKADLEKLLSVDFNLLTEPDQMNKHYIILTFSGKYVLATNLNDSSNIYKYDWLGLYLNDIEIHPRLGKAFKHLAYLAQEKRKKERKESGEKF